VAALEPVALPFPLAPLCHPTLQPSGNIRHSRAIVQGYRRGSSCQVACCSGLQLLELLVVGGAEDPELVRGAACRPLRGLALHFQLVQQQLRKDAAVGQHMQAGRMTTGPPLPRGA
jgi:hypothetical protein